MRSILSFVLIFYLINISTQFLESYFIRDNHFYESTKINTHLDPPIDYIKCSAKIRNETRIEKCGEAVISRWGEKYFGEHIPKNNKTYCCSIWDYFGLCINKYLPYVCNDDEVKVINTFNKVHIEEIQNKYCNDFPYLSEVCYAINTNTF